MPNLTISIKRFKTFMNQVKRLQESDFPDAESRDALTSLEQLVTKRIRLLEKTIKGSPSESGAYEYLFT